jgi:SNF2 family DNA or RNA helicase
MPKSVVGNWLSEFRKWCPHIKVCNLIARKECREDIIKNEIIHLSNNIISFLKNLIHALSTIRFISDVIFVQIVKLT